MPAPAPCYHSFMQALATHSRPRRRGPPPTGKGTQVVVRMQPDLLSALDAFVTGDGEGCSRPEAVRHILSDWLTGHGYLPHRDDPEGAN